MGDMKNEYEWMEPASVEIEVGRCLWDFRTGERRVYWRPLVVTMFRKHGDVLYIEPPVPPGARVRVTTSSWAFGGEVFMTRGPGGAVGYGVTQVLTSVLGRWLGTR